MALRGGRELRARLRAIQQSFKPIGKDWADQTVVLARSRVPVTTGRTRNSIRRKNASLTRAAVEARGGARFLEAGTKPHPIRAHRMRAMKFNVGGRTVFAKKVNHPGGRKQPFLRNSGREVLAAMDLLRSLIDQWNRAA